MSKREIVDITVRLKAESGRGFLLDDGKTTAWVPKSQVEKNPDGTFTMPEWLALDKGFI